MTVMYLGPEIRGVVKHKQVFSYNAEDVITEAIEREPLSKYLFVDMNDIVNKKRELEEPGSLMNVAFKKILHRRKSK